MALPCPVCDKRNFIDGNSISNTEYIELLISEVSKQTKIIQNVVEENRDFRKINTMKIIISLKNSKITIIK